MVAIRLSAIVGKDRRLIVDLPADAPIGPMEVVITPAADTPHLEREEIRARLQAAGLLVKPEDMDIPNDLEYVSDEELEELESLPPGTPSSLDLINEDRGSY